MTKKDYEMVARALNKWLEIYHERATNGDNETPIYTVSKMHDAQVSAVSFVTDSLAHEFAQDNPRFNKDIFDKACGMGEK